MNINIRDMSKEFLSYYEKSKKLSFEDKVILWKELYESKNSDVFEAVVDLAHIFYADYKLEDRYEYAFKNYEKVYNKILSISENIYDTVFNIANKCKDMFEVKDNEIDSLNFVVFVGLFMADGWNTIFKGKSTTFFAIENMPNKTENVNVFLAHEVTHGVHTSLVKFDKQETLAESLFLEGFAVATSEKMFPGFDEITYLNVGVKVVDDWLDRCVDSFPALKEDVKENLGNNSDEYKALYFGGESKNIPMRAGYTYGYHMVKELLNEYSFSELIRWDKYRIREEVRKYYEKL